MCLSNGSFFEYIIMNNIRESIALCSLRPTVSKKSPFKFILTTKTCETMRPNDKQFPYLTRLISQKR